MKRILSRYIGVLLFLVPLSANAELRGYELVMSEMPALYRAVAKESGINSAIEFFADWEKQDIDFLRGKFRGLLDVTHPDKPFVPDLGRLSLSYDTHIFGCAGEAYGNVRMRKLLKPGELYMDSSEYDRLNPDGNKPDGLIYSIEGENIVLSKIMESKLGSSSWSASQIQGFLDQWSRNGIKDKDGRHFRPDHIFFQTAAGRRTISSMTVETARENAVLVATRALTEFPGTLAQLPISATQLRSSGITYLDNLRANRSAPKGSSKEPTPVLEGEQLEDFKVALEDFMVEHRRWPGNSDGPLGAFLAKTINRRGGQTKVLINDLPGYFRHYLTVWGSLPAMSPFANNILAMDPAHPEAASVLRSYIRKYESRKLGAPSQIHDLLIKTNPAWVAFFEAHPLESLRVADLNEVNLCLDVLRESAK